MWKTAPVPSAARAAPNKFNISEFLGVDFTSGNMLSDIRRSPDAINMVWGSNPQLCQTRNGYKRLLNSTIRGDNNLPSTIYGIHTFADEAVEQMLIHADDKLYIINADGDTEEVYTGLTKTFSASFVFGDHLYVIGCGKYLQWNGFECNAVSDIAFVPTTVINSFPSLLFRDTYFGDGEKTEFALTRNSDRNGEYIKVYLNSEEVTGYTFSDGALTFSSAVIQDVEVRIEYLIKSPSGQAFEAVNLLTPKRINSFVGDGITKEFYLDSQDIDEIIEVKVEGIATTDYTADLSSGTVTIITAPPNGNGIDNVTIEYSNEIEGYSDKINNCSIFNIFGGNNDTRVFLSGNPSERNVDWQSGLYDATYFPDTGYTKIGSDNTAIVGYVKQFDTQMIIKAGNTQDTTAYLRLFALDNNGTAYFPVEHGAVGTGAFSKRSFGYLQGEPLFLSEYGVVGVTGTNVDNQRLIQDRSTLINTRLTKEPNLNNAFALVYKDRYHLYINGQVYVCDARMRYEDNLGQIQYEWNYWTDVYATAGAVFGDYMYIGYLGQIYRYKDNERDIYSDDGRGIISKWTTPTLYFGDASVRKTVDYVYALMSNINQNDVDIECIINGQIRVPLGEISGGRIFNYMDFNYRGLSYLTSINRYAVRLRANLKKVDNLQFVFTNNGTNKSAMGMTLFQADFILLTR